jgi:predicted esterase YcpF (UPF0227 family)
MTGPIDHLLYLHGFRSSPQSFKARRLEAWLHEHRPDVTWACPQLPPSPRAAVELASRLIARWPVGRFAVLGSSLGGFYASVLAERTDCPAVVMNPAVDPARDLAAHVGEQSAFHDPSSRFTFEPRFIDELHALEPGPITRPQRYLAIIAKGDELLDWREMSHRFAGCALHLIEGSDHGLSDFDAHLPRLLGFLGLAPTD